MSTPLNWYVVLYPQYAMRRPIAQTTHETFALSLSQAQYFITAKDSLELGNTAVDDLLPYISDIAQGIQKIDIPTSDTAFKAKEKIIEWHSKLLRMKAVDSLEDEEIRQLKLDLETSQGLIYQFLGAVKK